MRALVELKHTTLVGTTKGSVIIPLEVEVDEGPKQQEYTPEQIASSLAMDYFLRNQIISAGDVIEIRSVRIL